MFTLAKYLGGRGAYPDIVEIPENSTLTYEAGLALVITSGKAALATGTVKPAFVAAGPAHKGMVPCWAVSEDTVFEVKAAGTHTVGASYTIASNGKDVTTTTTDGVAKCIRANDERDKILVVFEK